MQITFPANKISIAVSHPLISDYMAGGFNSAVIYYRGQQKLASQLYSYFMSNISRQTSRQCGPVLPPLAMRAGSTNSLSVLFATDDKALLASSKVVGKGRSTIVYSNNRRARFNDHSTNNMVVRFH